MLPTYTLRKTCTPRQPRLKRRVLVLFPTQANLLANTLTAAIIQSFRLLSRVGILLDGVRASEALVPADLNFQADQSSPLTTRVA